MALSAIDDTTSTRLHFFAIVQAFDRTAGTTATLYWGEGDCLTDKVDGTSRQWEGRIDGCGHRDPDQKIGGSRYSHPSADLSVWLGGNADADDPDDLWDYFADDQQWEGQSLKLYLVDMSQDAGAGAEIVFHGKVGARPVGLRENAYFKLRGVGRHQGEFVPNARMSMPSKWRAGYVQPVIWAGNQADLTGNVNANQTTFSVNSTSTLFQGQVAMICDAGASTNAELLYIDSITGSNDFEVIRGYHGSTAAAHSTGDWVYAMTPGPSRLARLDHGADRVLPIVGGTGSADRGVIDVSDYMVGRPHRIVSGGVEAWASSGKGPRVMEDWDNEGGTIQVQTPGAAGTYNDWDDVNGHALAYGDAIGGATDYHLEPHPWPSGTYWETGVSIMGFAAAQINVWARIRGITRDDTETGVRCQNATDWIKYLLENTYAGLGYTLSDVVDGDRIDGWGSGDFDDEYTESWFDQLAWIAPAFGASSSPYALDVLQEACDCSSADLMVRGGLLWPARRKVAVSADLTVEEHHIQGAKPVRLDDPQGTYCNVLRVSFAQSLLSEPDDVNDREGVNIPMESVIGDDDEIALYGEAKEVTLARKWHYFNLFEDWKQNTAPTEHLLTSDTAHQEHLAMRAQPQIYVEATLTENCSWIGQGHTIEYNITGITTRKGQVRQVERRRSPQGNSEQRQPIVTKVRSWHISFPT